MSRLKIQTTDDKAFFRPGGVISGKLLWQLDKPQDFLEIILYWKTTGRRAQFGAEAGRVEIENPALCGEERFAFNAPLEPFTYYGLCMKIHWLLKTSCGKDSSEMEIIIAPDGYPVDFEEPYEADMQARN